MVSTITLPSSALGFSLDSNNQYKISVTLVMKEIIKLIKDLSVNSYLKHHKIKYRYTFYINGTRWKYTDTYSELTNTNVSFINEDIVNYLDSNKVKQILSCTVEVSHPQFYCNLNSEQYTFIAINKKPAQLKAKNSATGNYETIGLSFNDLSSGAQTDLNEIRWPVFNTENSAQQFVIPIGNVSSTRRNGSIRAERFGGVAGQYFNLDTNPNSNKNFERSDGTEYRYSDTFTPTFRYYDSYEYVGTKYYSTTDSYYWTNNTLVSVPTLTTGSNAEGRYTSYSFTGWERQYTFKHSYFVDETVYAPNAQSIWFGGVAAPNLDSLPSSDEFGFSKRDWYIYTFGRDFTVSYTDEVRYYTSTYWPSTATFITGGSIYVDGKERYGDNWVFDRWSFEEGTKTYYNCAGSGEHRYLDSDRYYYSSSTPAPKYDTRYNSDAYYGYYYSGIKKRYTQTEKYYYINYTSVRYTEIEEDYIGYSYYEKWKATYKHPFLSYDFYITRSYTTKSSTITGYLAGDEKVYKRWWQYEDRTNWSIDSNNELRYSTNNQKAITNDRTTYKTS